MVVKETDITQFEIELQILGSHFYTFLSQKIYYCEMTNVMGVDKNNFLNGAMKTLR